MIAQQLPLPILFSFLASKYLFIMKRSKPKTYWNPNIVSDRISYNKRTITSNQANKTTLVLL